MLQLFSPQRPDVSFKCVFQCLLLCALKKHGFERETRNTDRWFRMRLWRLGDCLRHQLNIKQKTQCCFPDVQEGSKGIFYVTCRCMHPVLPLSGGFICSISHLLCGFAAPWATIKGRTVNQTYWRCKGSTATYIIFSVPVYRGKLYLFNLIGIPLQHFLQVRIMSWHFSINWDLS